jgi:hypothetical protein
MKSSKAVFYIDSEDRLRVFTPKHFDATKRPDSFKAVPHAAPKKSATQAAPQNFHLPDESGFEFPQSTRDGGPPTDYIIPTQEDANKPVPGKGVTVKKSRIHGAGLGLFATKKFRRGEIVTYYGGYVLPSMEVANRISADSDYLIQDDKGRVWDGKYILKDEADFHLGRWINDAVGSIYKNNVVAQTKYYEEDKLILIVMVAERTIKKNQEILFGYGEHYWEETTKLHVKQK